LDSISIQSTKSFTYEQIGGSGGRPLGERSCVPHAWAFRDRSICAQGNRAGLLADTEVDFALAQKLGGEVVLMGHSTRALLLTWLAIRNPGKVARLILLSPAFGVHSLAQAGAWTAYLTRIDLVTADGEVSTGHSGLEVSRAARAFRAWLRANSRDGGLYTCHVPFNYENEFSYFQLLTSAINLIMGF
jgi:pimeloyl-ACP methyl ester carboxylesterase